VRVFFNDETYDGTFIPIGKISAPSNWYGERSALNDKAYRERALKNLINAAEDIDADAIVSIEYSIDHVDACDIPGGAFLQRVFASGVAVKFSPA
jgi:uncharacterized protein YbjQ (UPF0145 family)